ncbi:hypothetical protein, partial [Clostridium tepidiprofundi]|uniref:hypothetical protein n=1 Tax=Clostridium tepidiprofundi TaxID=420412 RepID=UPI00128F8213
MISKYFLRFQILLVCIVFIITGCTSSPSCSKKTESNYTSFELSDTHKHIKILDDAIPKYEIFLTGESHHIDVNFPLETFFLKYLVVNGNIKYFIPELPHSIACRYEEYLKT